MTVVEALIIYLSVGAPFGVLVFFASSRSTRPALVYSVLATVGWPLIAGRRIFSALSRVNDQQQIRGELSELEVLLILANEIPTEPSELFEIAGHPNPWLATQCYARSRKNVVRSHIGRIKAPTSLTEEGFQIVASPEFTAVATSVVGS